MSDGKKYYCFCGSNCKYETMTKEQILTAIAEAVSTGTITDVDTGFVTTLKEQNGGKGVTFWVGTQAQYNALADVDPYCLYIITDDTKIADMAKTVENTAEAAENAKLAAVNAEELARQSTASATDANANAASAAAAADRAAESASGALAAAEDARKAAETMGAAGTVDITNTMSFSWEVGSGGANLTECYISKNSIVYSPLLGMVFFNFDFTYTGAMAKGETVKFVLGGSHLPSVETTAYTKNNFFDFAVDYWTDSLRIKAKEAFDTQGARGHETICGWYICNKE